MTAAGRYTERWACPKPEVGRWYLIIRQEWSEDYTVRTIHEWRYPEEQTA